MRKQYINTINQTFSIPRDVSQDLHVYVKQREMSRFVSNAIRKELEAKKEELREAYRMANEDEGQNETKKDWEATMADGLDDEWQGFSKTG